MTKFSKLAVIFVAIASFGFAHAADARQTITEIVAKSGGEFDRKRYDYDILLNAVITANLADALNDPDANLTVFAPNDAAFIKLARDLGYHGRDEAGSWAFLVEALTDLGDGDPIPVLTDILLYHVVPKRVGVFRFIRLAIYKKHIPTLLGETVRPFLFGLIDKEPDLRNPRLTLPVNVRASNGIIHTLNRVLIPVNLP
jgi:uncharacterized surface protein with fasciclin (FAS1) repeats